MKKLKKILLCLMLALFMPLVFVGCGENGIAKISAKKGTLLTSWEVNQAYTYNDLIIVLEYEDGTNMNFDNKNKSIIDAIVVEQRIAKERKKAISFDLSSISKTNSNTLENDEVIEEKRFKVKKVENSKLKGVKTNMILNAISFACWSLSTLLSIVNPETYSSFTHLYVLFSISSCFNMIDSIAKKTSLEKQIKEQEIEERLNEMKNIAEKGKSK